MKDLTGEDELQKIEAKCPDCGKESTYIGIRFRAPKATNIKAWNSIKILADVNLFRFNFFGGTIQIPNSEKKLRDLLLTGKECAEKSIRFCLSAEYNNTNKDSIKRCYETIRKIDLYLVNNK
ncbi:MAG: hypothetical protein ACKOXB_09625 [Flavobacteriales bacterium]